MSNHESLTVGDLLDTLAAVDRDVPVFVGNPDDGTYRDTYLPVLVPVVQEAPGEFREAEPDDSGADIITAVFLGRVREEEVEDDS